MTFCGYAERILRVDLTKNKIAPEPMPADIAEKYVGGAGFGARYLYDESPGPAKWDDPENPIIFGAGPLSYTAMRGSGTICIVTRGPMTEMAGSSQGNGYFGAYLKSCGYDAMVIKGCAEKWSYLIVSDNELEIRNADHLVGLDSFQLQEALKKEMGRTRGISIYGIGPAAENLVKYSMIIGDITHTVSKNGMGAVMASKKIKAVVVIRGSFKAKIHDEIALKEISKQLHEKAINYMNGSRHKYGTNGTFSNLHRAGALPVKNYTTNIFAQHEKMDGRHVRSTFERVKRNPCFNCGINHNLVWKVTEGPHEGLVAEEPEYECFAAFGSQIGQSDAGTVFFLTEIADRLGLDANECGWVIGWAMECYEKGLLTNADTDGLELNWGNAGAVEKLLYKIARREGFGDLLAEGVKRASEKIGGEAVNMAIHSMKGSTPRGHDHRARWPELVDTCLSNTSTLEATFVGARPHFMEMPPPHDTFSPWEVPLINAFINGWHTIEDCVGACRFNQNYPDLVIKALNAVTGKQESIADMIQKGKRTVNVLRVFNLKCGLIPEMDAPSRRYGSKPVDGPAEGKTVEPHWPIMRKVYYRAMGWEPDTGRPLPETLQALDLDDLVEEIW